MKAVRQNNSGGFWTALWRRVAKSRNRLLIPVIAVAGGLVLLVTYTQSGFVGKCRADAGPNIDWSDCRKRMLMLDGSSFDGGQLKGTDLSRSDLSRTSLKGADFTKAVLMRASLSNADAQDANFSKIEGYRAEFPGIDARGASFVSAEMQRANFTGAQLEGTDFTKAELGRAIFYKAKLGNTSFATTNLSRATFHNTQVVGPVDFTNAFLFLTRIEAVDLSQAVGLKQDQVDLACGDDKTKLPAGISVPTSWPCDND